MKETKQEKRRANGEGSLLKLKDCRFWYAQFYSNGRQVRVSTKTENKTAAQSILRKYLGEKDSGVDPVIEDRKLRYADIRQLLLDDYKTGKKKSLREDADGNEYVEGLPPLDEFAEFQTLDGEVKKKGVLVSEMTRAWATQFARKRMDEGVGSAYINRSLACLRRMMRLAQEEGKIRVVPKFKFLPEPAARKGFLDDTQFEKLLTALPSYLKPLAECLYSTGARVGEVRQVTWAQVDLDSGIIRLEPEQTKNAQARLLPMSSRLSAMLRELKQALEPKRHDIVFEDTNLRKSWEAACDSCGLGKVTRVEGEYYTTYTGLRIHDLRRSAVRNMVKEGTPQTVAMRISGHKTDNVFRRYAIVSDEDIREAARRRDLSRVKALQGAVIEGNANDGSEFIVKSTVKSRH